MDSKLGSEKTFVFESRKQTKVQLCDEREKKKNVYLCLVHIE